jgi:NitT/TauT family transport system permease protein
MLDAFAPNKVVTKSTAHMIVWVQVAIAAALWVFSSVALLPTPLEVWSSFTELWQRGLAAELITSFTLNLKAIGIASALSLLLSYLTVMPFFRPVVAMIGKLRFLSLVGLSFVFTMMVTSPHWLKVSLLVFSITVFFVTSMADVLASIPREQYDLARTLRMSEWRVVWEVIVLGQFDKAFDVIRQNAAIGWVMLTLVESVVRSEGGIGTMLLDQNHHFRLSGIFAIQATILLLGLAQDYGLGIIKTFVCPYANLTTERK